MSREREREILSLNILKVDDSSKNDKCEMFTINLFFYTMYDRVI